jgi:hypothetical protein
MENYYNGLPVKHPLPPTPIQGYPHLPGLQVPNYSHGHNIQTGNMYIPTNNNMNQQIPQVPNTITQPYFMPAATTSAQQPYQQTALHVNQHKAHTPMDDYELTDDGSVNEEPGNTSNDWQCVQNNKRRKLTKSQPTKGTNFNISQRNRFESLADADEDTKESADAQ